jgi:hypothetical protein
MRFIYSDSFVENVEKLSKEEKKLLKEKLSLIFKKALNLFKPGLKFIEMNWWQIGN